MRIQQIAAALAAVATGMTATAATTTLRVVANIADKSRPGWEDAYTSIQDAISAIPTSSAAQGYNTILVASGTYNISETISVPTDKKWIHIRSVNIDTGDEDPEHTILDGGGTTSIMETKVVRTFISGFTFANGYTNCVEEASGTDCKIGAAALMFRSGYGSVSNCIFRGNSSLNTRGTCISVDCPTPKSYLISNCIFTNNTQSITHSGKRSRGCAIFIPSLAADAGYDDTTIRNCLFDDNRASASASFGSMLYATHTTIEDCAFLTNRFTHTSSSQTSQGGQVLLGASCTMRNCRFTGISENSNGNTLNGTIVSVASANGCKFINCDFDGIQCEESNINTSGGLVYVGQVSSIEFTGCRFLNNVMTARIAQIMVDNSSNVLLRNCLFSGLSRPNTGTTIIRQNSCNGAVGVMAENCTFADNGDKTTFGNNNTSSCTNYLVNSVFTAPVSTTPAVVASNCCFTALLNGANDYGNFTPADVGGDLKFVDAANGDFHLQESSPLRDKGMILPWMAGGTDLDGNPRIVSGSGVSYSSDPSALPDIGCYECILRAKGFTIVFR